MNTKESILKELTENKGKFISGEQLSEALGITRTAVWKHILKLREEGYIIRAISRRGYLLEGSKEIYDKSAIVSQLRTKILGKTLHFYREVDSTNDVLKRLAASGSPEGTVVIAEQQSAGRGRRGRTWSSQPNQGIYMSVLLKPDIEPAMVQSITLAASSAVCNAITPYSLTKPGIKWPNDILIENKKVCGILTEMIAEPEKIQSLIVGIGVNVNHTTEDFGEELQLSAASLCMYSKERISRSELVAKILEEFESLYLDFSKNRSTSRFLNMWRSYSVTIGYDIIIHQGDALKQARALDVLDDGCLLVEFPDGQRQTVSSGEISIRRME